MEPGLIISFICNRSKFCAMQKRGNLKLPYVKELLWFVRYTNMAAMPVSFGLYGTAFHAPLYGEIFSKGAVTERIIFAHHSSNHDHIRSQMFADRKDVQQADDPQHHVEAIDHMTSTTRGWVEPESETNEKRYHRETVKKIPFT